LNELVWISLAGAAGSFHCLGMCSGFALSLAPSRTARWKTLGRHLTYNTGRVTTYCFLGVLAGTLGQAVLQGGAVGALQRLLAVVSGILMIVMGLGFFGVRLRLRPGARGEGAGSHLRGIRGLLRAPGAAAPLAFGVFNGFLPCPLVYAFVAQAVAAGSLARGLGTMAAFGAGTFPAMLGVGLAGCSLSPSWRMRGVRLAGAVILLFGGITIARGLLPTIHPMAHSMGPAMAHSTATPAATATAAPLAASAATPAAAAPAVRR
jgi:sulfite exporter TauE/SafE